MYLDISLAKEGMMAGSSASIGKVYVHNKNTDAEGRADLIINPLRLRIRARPVLSTSQNEAPHYCHSFGLGYVGGGGRSCQSCRRSFTE
jgi:hypothetical protein